MAFINILVLGLATFVLGKDLLLGPMPISDPVESQCMVWTVVEQPIYINTCFSSSTVATFNGFTTTIPKPTCIDTIITSSQTLNPPTQTSNVDEIQYTTLTTDIYTTVCPSPTTFTYGTRIYTVTDATTITITDCPCTYSTAITMSFRSTLATSSPTSSQKKLSSPSSTPSLLPSTTAPFVPVSTGGMCGAGVGLTCQGSGFGNCCGSENTCGHNAAHCGTGCQSGYGYCTLISNDGTCGNNVTCEGSGFGPCCSEYFFCGTGLDFCGTGCHPGLGQCDPPNSTLSTSSMSTTVSPSIPCSYTPSSTISAISTSTPNSCVYIPSSSDNCTTADIAPGSTPVSIGNATLGSIPAPAVYNYGGSNYSFGFTGDTNCPLAYAETDPAISITDQLAFYEVSTAIVPPTNGYCSAYGYLYQVDSGLCVTANKTQGAYPDYEAATLMLEPCQVCNDTQPPTDQMFCVDQYNAYGLYQCIIFVGDTTSLDYYGVNYGTGPGLTEATVLRNGGDCILMLFP